MYDQLTLPYDRTTGILSGVIRLDENLKIE